MKKMGNAHIKNIIFLLTLSPALQDVPTDGKNRTQRPNSSQRKSLGPGESDIFRKLPNGVVHYYVDTRAYDSIVAFKVRTAMDIIEGASCLRFRDCPTPGNITQPWFHITNPKGERACVHQPQFNKNGEIVLVLGYDCLSMTQILHTVLHGVGFKDEVTNSNRDKYVRVQWQNIQPAFHELFIQSRSKLDDIVEYDPSSVMHFADHDYSINGEATIVPVPPGMIIGPSDSLSQLDKMRLKVYFSHACNNREVDSVIKSCRKTFHSNASEEMKFEKFSYMSYYGDSLEKINEDHEVDPEEHDYRDKEFVVIDDNNYDEGASVGRWERIKRLKRKQRQRLLSSNEYNY